MAIRLSGKTQSLYHRDFLTWHICHVATELVIRHNYEEGRDVHFGPDHYRPKENMILRFTAKIVFGVVLLVLSLPILCHGDENRENQDFEGSESLWQAIEKRVTRKKDLGKGRIFSPIVFPFYTPELEFGLAIGGLVSFQTGPEESTQQRSTLRANVLGTSNEAIGFVTRLNTFWNDDRFRFNVDLGGKDAANNYYGIGYDAGFDVPEGPNTTLYEYGNIILKPDMLWRVKGDLFLGLNAEFNYFDAGEVAERIEEDPLYQEFGSSYFSSGVGVTVAYDTRDVTVNAHSGLLAEFTSTHYLEAIGSDNDFDLYSLDYRHYFTLWRDGVTLAFRGLGEFADGDIPWSMYPVVGGSRKLRGYNSGRFRDKTVVTGVVEYRHQFLRGNESLSPHGVVFWLGYGFLGEDWSDLNGNGLPNLGFGYRLELQKRMNLRLDFGFGDDDRGVYLSVNESF